MQAKSKLINDVISEAIGEDVLPLVRLLRTRKSVSEIDLAMKMKIDVNDVRNGLYRLYHMNLVSFTRKKDEKNGWYTYFWSFEASKIRELSYSMQKKRIGMLKERLAREQGEHFYVCADSCVKTAFEKAIEANFKCPECGRLMDSYDNISDIERLKKDLKELEVKIKH